MLAYREPGKTIFFLLRSETKWAIIYVSDCWRLRIQRQSRYKRTRSDHTDRSAFLSGSLQRLPAILVKRFRSAAPFNKKLCKNQQNSFLELTNKEENSVDGLNGTVENRPVLALLHTTGYYDVDMDACDTQLWTTLLQRQPEGNNRRISYWSRTLDDSEKKLATTHKGAMPLCSSGCVIAEHYLKANIPTFSTDYKALKWLLTVQDASGNLARWYLRLLKFEFDIAHRAGFKYQAVDALSRLPTARTKKPQQMTKS